MATDKLDLLGPAMAKIGEEAMRIVGGKPDGVYLYVEIGDGWVGPSLFKDEGNRVQYFNTSDSDLCDLLFDAWYLEEPNKRWSVMHYTVDGGKFDASFEFEELGIDIDDRRERILRARYGDKPIVYPPMPDDLMELQRDR